MSLAVKAESAFTGGAYRARGRHHQAEPSSRVASKQNLQASRTCGQDIDPRLRARQNLWGPGGNNMKRGFAIGVLAGIACTAIAAAGCTRTPTGVAQYFPLKPGMAWTFRFTGSTGATGELTTTNQAPRQIFGFKTVPQQNTRRR